MILKKPKKEFVFILVIILVTLLAITLIINNKLDEERALETEGYIAIGDYSFNREPLTRQNINGIFLYVSIVTLFFFILNRFTLINNNAYYFILLIILSFSLFFNFYQNALTRHRYFDIGDTFHYYLGPRYYSELGYDRLYICAAQALADNNRDIPVYVRDLKTNQVTRTANYLTPEQRKYCFEHFGERWEDFSQDILQFRDWHNDVAFQRRFADHGYNGTPVWTLFASLIAKNIPVNHKTLTIVSLLNPVMVMIMLLFIFKAFGGKAGMWETALLFSIFFCVNFPDRFIMGGGLIRPFWLMILIIGLSLWKTEKYRLAGAFLGLASMLIIFPILFMAGPAILYLTTDSKDMKQNYRGFLISAFIVMAVLFILSIGIGNGLDNYTGFFEQMSLNSGRLATGRIGFIYNFIWPKEIAMSSVQLDYEPRYEQLSRLPHTILSYQKLYWLLVAIFVLMIISFRKKIEGLDFSILLGFSLFFLLLSTVRYYYAGLLGLPLIFNKEYRFMWIPLFMCNIATYLSMPYTIYSFRYNTLLTVSYTLLISLMIIAIFREKLAVDLHGKYNYKKYLNL